MCTIRGPAFQRPRRAAVVPLIARRRPVAPPLRAGLGDAVNKFFNSAKASVALGSAGEYDVQAISTKLADYISSNKVVVFSWTGCPVSHVAHVMVVALGMLETGAWQFAMFCEGAYAILGGGTSNSTWKNLHVKCQCFRTSHYLQAEHCHNRCGAETLCEPFAEPLS